MIKEKISTMRKTMPSNATGGDAVERIKENQ